MVSFIKASGLLGLCAASSLRGNNVDLSLGIADNSGDLYSQCSVDQDCKSGYVCDDRFKMCSPYSNHPTAAQSAAVIAENNRIRNGGQRQLNSGPGGSPQGSDYSICTAALQNEGIDCVEGQRIYSEATADDRMHSGAQDLDRSLIGFPGRAGDW